MSVKNVTTIKIMSATIAALFMLPVSLMVQAGVGDDTTASASSDVIAKVGDQSIRFSEINTVLNSSAIVGLSMPAIGTPDRDTARITLLDKFVSANLIYLDALKQGVDKDARYQLAISRFSNAILAGLYRRNIQAGDIKVSEDEVLAYYKKNALPDTKLDDALHTQIEAQLHRQKLHARLKMADKSLRDGVKVKVFEENLDSKDDAARADNTPVAEVDTQTITWGQVRDKLIAAGKGATKIDPLSFEDQARRDALDSEIDLRIMAQKARAAGYEKDPIYVKRVDEYSKSLLTNMYRDQLVKQMQPTDMELEAYYTINRNRFAIPEARKVQMVVVADESTAESIRDKVRAGELTMYQAAQKFSIAANAKQNLGEVGWLSRGQMVPTLDKAIFALEPGSISDPVKSPAGWHILSILEVKDARFDNFADAATKKLTLRSYQQEKLDAYTAALRENHTFPVEVFQDRLVQLSQQEADMVKTLAEKAGEPGSVTKKRIEELNKMMIRPPS